MSSFFVTYTNPLHVRCYSAFSIPFACYDSKPVDLITMAAFLAYSIIYQLVASSGKQSDSPAIFWRWEQTDWNWKPGHISIANCFESVHSRHPPISSCLRTSGLSSTSLGVIPFTSAVVSISIAPNHLVCCFYFLILLLFSKFAPYFYRWCRDHWLSVDRKLLAPHLHPLWTSFSDFGSSLSWLVNCATK